MPSSEKDLVHDSQPPSSFGNHSTRTGEHDQPPKPEQLAGPSESLRQGRTDLRFPLERAIMAGSLSSTASTTGYDIRCRHRYVVRRSTGKR
jgi:hypothetical protein